MPASEVHYRSELSPIHRLDDVRDAVPVYVLTFLAKGEKIVPYASPAMFPELWNAGHNLAAQKCCSLSSNYLQDVMSRYTMSQRLGFEV